MTHDHTYNDEVVSVAPGMTRLRLPMLGNPLRFVNAYCIERSDGLTLVDCGWKTDDVLEALKSGLSAIGRQIDDIKRIVITHVHYDHYGLAGTLLRLGVPELAMHRRDWETAQAMLRDPQQANDASDGWLTQHGFVGEPSSVDDQHFVRNELTEPTHLIEDGEDVAGLEVIWTPGHSPGHLCFLDRSHSRMLTGDHVLRPVTPHVGAWWPTPEDRLGDFIASLKKIGAYDVETVLPAHGDSFDGLATRVDELLAHHYARECAVIDILGRYAGSTAAAVARILPWTRRATPYDDLGEYHQAFAVAETIAHLEHLVVRARASRELRDDFFVYTLR